MAYSIIFSKPYIDVLKKISRILKICQRNHILLFQDKGLSKISLMDMNVIIHIKADSAHANINSEELGITNLDVFLKYLDAVNYPEGKTSISCSVERSTKGKDYESFVIKGLHATYRMVVATPTIFVPRYDRNVISERSSDVLKLVSQFYLDKDDVTRLEEDIRLVGGADLFTLMVDSGEIHLFMRGLQNEQVTKKIDPLKVRVFDDYTTKGVPGEDPFRIFPSRFFKYMSQFNCDFDVEIRVLERLDGNIVAIKAYGKIEIIGQTPIEIMIGTQESSAAVVMNSFEVIE